MPNILRIIDITSPEGAILKREARGIDRDEIKWRSTQRLIDDMVHTYKEAGLVGLAAPQVNEPIMIIVVSSKPRPTYQDAPVVDPFAMINPVILERSDEKAVGWEGCGSLKNEHGYPRARIERNQRVMVTFLGRDGERVTKEFEGFLARVIQHECDHLAGVMFTDRIAPGERLYEEPEYSKLIEGEKASA